MIRVLWRLVRPTSLMSASFMLLATGIVSNALFLQGRPHPSPLFEGQGGELARIDLHPASGEEPARVRPDDLVIAVQNALRAMGFYSGDVDGIAGARTIAAIRSFQNSVGADVTGEVSLDLLGLLNAPPAVPDPIETQEGQTAEVISPPPDSRLQIVQGALAAAAYGPLPADGLFGPQTRDAIARFQRDHGLSVTGEYSEALVVELRAVGALAE